MTRKFNKRSNSVKGIVPYDIEKVDLYLTSSILDTMIKSFFSNNENIKIILYKKIDNLMKLADVSMFDTDIRMIVRVNILNNLTSVRVDSLVSNPELLYNACLDGKYDEETEDIFMSLFNDDNFELSDEEIAELDRYLSERLHFAYLYQHLPRLESLSMQLKSGSVGDLNYINEEAEEILSQLKEDLTIARNSALDNERTFIGSKDNNDGKDMVQKMVKTKEGRHIRTDIKYMNKMLGGGWERGRSYCFVAVPKAGKSATLLDFALQAKKSNPHIKSKDPTKKPAIVYITQENRIPETLERAWSHYFGVDPKTNYKNFTDDEVVEKFESVNFFNNDDSEEMSIIIIYRDLFEITADDIETIVQNEVTEKGYECQAIFHDYLKRLRPKNPKGDDRLDFGAIANELTYLASRMDVPLITATQMNRNGASIVEENPDKAHKLLSSRHIADSFLIVENMHGIILLNYVEEFEDGKMTPYMMFKLTEPRFRVPDDAEWTWFHPLDNRMRMSPDSDHVESKSRTEVNISSTPLDVTSMGVKLKQAKPKATKLKSPDNPRVASKESKMDISPTINATSEVETKFEGVSNTDLILGQIDSDDDSDDDIRDMIKNL